jgi:hypothetical protein
MPVIHRYTDGRGHYIKTSFAKTMVTYQVTADGEHYLKRRGKRDGSRLSRPELQEMLRKGYIYTHGTGPGDVEPLLSFRRGGKGQRRVHRKKTRGSQTGCPCCGAIVFSGLLLSTATILVGMKYKRR